MAKDKDLIPGKWYALMSGTNEYILKFKKLGAYVSAECFIDNQRMYQLGGDFSKNEYDFREVSAKEVNQYLPADKQEQVELPIFN